MGIKGVGMGLASQLVSNDVVQTRLWRESNLRSLIYKTEEEYKKGHVDTKKIMNIPYMFNTPKGMVKNPQFLEEVSSACNKDDLIVVGCQSGVRSLYATADLLAAGFKNVSNMGGGYLAWVEHDFPVTKLEYADRKKPEDVVQPKKAEDVDQQKKAEEEL
ncbi:thiosulfate sulfurtransferase 18-like isoform X3 [Pyrus communis]|uniref:thiosulfate sulfurtransferase 18-like isoform X3 n=1 Tax=Pyrus communis TaxID=23211 RepID=UPI0035BEDCD5